MDEFRKLKSPVSGSAYDEPKRAVGVAGHRREKDVGFELNVSDGEHGVC